VITRCSRWSACDGRSSWVITKADDGKIGQSMLSVQHLLKAAGIKDTIGPVQQRVRVCLGDAFTHLVTGWAEAAFEMA